MLQLKSNYDMRIIEQCSNDLIRRQRSLQAFNSNQKKNLAVATLSFTKQHVSNQTGGGCEKGEAETCQQEVSGGTGHPEGQTDGPRHKDASGGEASTPVCPHTVAGGCTSNKRQGSAPQGHGGLKLCESRNRESFICVFHACVCVCLEVLPLPPAGHTLTCRCSQGLAA